MTSLRTVTTHECIAALRKLGFRVTGTSLTRKLVVLVNGAHTVVVPRDMVLTPEALRLVILGAHVDEERFAALLSPDGLDGADAKAASIATVH
jgi:hypothetical protein